MRPLLIIVLVLLTITLPSPARADLVGLCVSLDPPGIQATGACGDKDFVLIASGPSPVQVIVDGSLLA